MLLLGETFLGAATLIGVAVGVIGAVKMESLLGR